MANTVTTTYLLNGSRYFTAKIDIVCDTAAELASVDIIDVASLTGKPTKFKIKNISWQLSNFYANLNWDATTDVQAVVLNQYEGELDFFKKTEVPIVNNAGAGVTGKLQIVTKGIAIGSTGTIIIRGYHK